MSTVEAADLYCGAGGTSAGLHDACDELKLELRLIAVNHWDVAIATHKANHPWATHYCQSVDNMNPREVVPGGRLKILVASPECIFHSNARGGRPINDQRRASAWHILRWAEALYIENILIENVPEFEDWGPLGANNKPIERMKGQTFLAFLAALRALGYHVDYRKLCCADYGDPTTRQRLFVMARRKKKILWPEATHSREGGSDMFGHKMEKWVAAREIIDWSILGTSIFSRKRPLATATLERIYKGFAKYGAKAEPFLVVLRKHGDARSLDKPLPTVTTSGNHFGVCEPFVLGQQSGAAGRAVSQPLPTISTAGAIALIQPFIVGAGGPTGTARPRSVDEPMKTVLCDDRSALVEPILLPKDRRHYHARPEAGVDPFIAKYYGTGVTQPVSEPLDTVTTKDRFGLVVPEFDGYHVDIRFRMLQAHELAGAQSLKGYKFTGKPADVKVQIGNAVPRLTAKALTRALLS